MIILVYVVEASGLNYPNHKIVATVSLGRNVLETKVSSPRNTTRFDSSLAWKTDIDSIKRMKSENVPIKVECFCIGKAGREVIGFVVVPLRSVTILTGNKVLNITPKWHRLIGLRHAWKTIKPEILMFVTITDVIGVQIINEMRNTTSTATKNMLMPQQGIHVELNRKDQHIQIGNSPLDCHRFTIEIHWHHCEWLSFLTENPSSENSFQMRYTLLDCPTEERNLPKMLGLMDEERYMVQEKITIQLRSSLSMLRTYFENVFYIPIYIYCKQEILGRLFFKISSALPDTNDLDDFLALTKNDTFVAISSSHIYPTKTNNTFIDDDHRPSLKYNLTLKYHHPSTNSDDESHKQSYEHEIYRNQENGHTLRQTPRQIQRQTLPSSTYQESITDNHQTAVQHKLSNEPQKSSHSDTKVPNNLDDDVLQSERESVEQSIKRRNVLIQKLLHSPIDPSISQRKKDSIRFVDVVTPPLQVQLDTFRQFEEHSPLRTNEVDDFDKLNQSPTVEIDMHCRSPKSVTFKPNPQSQDDFLAWRTKQQESFLVGLKKKENEHLKSVAEEWLIRQSKEEEKLAAKMKKCKLLTDALEHALSAIREKNAISMDHQKLAEVTHSEKIKQSEQKISALSDQIRRTAIDHDYQLKLMELKLKELDMKKKFTDDENEKLKTSLKKLEDENQFLRGRNIELDTTLNRKLQSAELKLKHAQELELFYKNKWTVAEEKLTGIRANKQNSQSNSNFSARVVDVLNSVRSDLEADKFELQSIKDMLD